MAQVLEQVVYQSEGWSIPGSSSPCVRISLGQILNSSVVPEASMHGFVCVCVCVCVS